MFTLEELSKKVAAYQLGSMSVAEFHNWFEDNSAGAYDSAELGDACIRIDAAFSEYFYDNVGEPVLKRELANAILPFEVLSARFDIPVPLPKFYLFVVQPDKKAPRVEGVYGVDSQTPRPQLVNF